MTIETPDRQIVAIQMLRGIAAIMVVFVHVDTELSHLHYATLGTAWLATGVDIFFVISGFIMWTSVERTPRVSPNSFFKNRLIRIVPLYWSVTTFVVFVGFLAPQLLKTTVLRSEHALASYLFLPARHPTTGRFWPVVVAGWSLNYEMLFYAVFAVAMAIAGDRRGRRLFAIAGMLLSTLILAKIGSRWVDPLNFYANPVLLEFLAGVMLAVMWQAQLVRDSPWWLTISVFGFGCLFTGVRFGLGSFATLCGASAVVAGAIFGPPARHNALSSLGDASYSLYLTHAIVLSAVAVLWAYLFRSLPSVAFVFCAVSTAIAVAVIVYLWFEAPITAKLKRRFGASRALASCGLTETLPHLDGRRRDAAR